MAGSVDLYRAALGCGLDFEGTSEDTQTGATPTRTAAPEPAATLVITIAPIQADIPEYDRGDWKHWTDAYGNC